MARDANRQRRIEELAADPDPLKGLREQLLAIDSQAIAQVAALKDLLDDVGFLISPVLRPFNIEKLAELRAYVVGEPWLREQLATLGGGGGEG